MLRMRIALSIIAMVLCGSQLHAQWPVTKTYQASTQSPQLVTTDQGAGNFRGWAPAELVQPVTRTLPGMVGGLPAELDTVQSGGKLKYSTSGSPWTFITATGTTTALKWRLYVSASSNSMPSVQIGTGNVVNRRFRLDFKTNIVTPQGVVSGWAESESTVVEEGGKLDSNGKRYLPMKLNEWHTIRFQVSPDASKPNGVRFDAWIDEEEGIGEALHIGGRSDNANSSGYVQWGAIVTLSATASFATNFIAWGQNSEIPPINATNAKDCDNPANCGFPVCLCAVLPENTQNACSNGLDDDGDGKIDCADTDCAAITHCGSEKPEYVVTLVRQIGHWQNSCNPFCGSTLYVSVYDENGTPLNGVTVRDPIRNINMVTANDPGQGIYGQGGHARHQGTNGLSGTFRFYVASDSGGVVSSEVTTTLISSVPPDGTLYSWQMEFMRKSKRSKNVSFNPTQPTYKFDAVSLNTPGGNNATLADDNSGLFTSGGEMFGQTFVANGDRIVSARFEVTRGFLQTLRYQATIHSLLNNPPTSLADIGPQIGATRMGPEFMIDSEWWTQMLNWPLEGAGSVPVTPGQTYFVQVRRADPAGGGYPAFTNFTSDGNYYPSGQAYRRPAGGGLVSDGAHFDLVGYIVAATTNTPTCVYDPVFDVAGAGVSGYEADGAVDQQDFGVFQTCLTGPNPGPAVFNAMPDVCRCMDLNADLSIDLLDYERFENCVTGPAPGLPVNPNCDD